MAVDNQQIQAPIVVEIQELDSPTDKKARQSGQAGLDGFLLERE